MRRGYSPAAIAAFVTTLVVLGLIGWSIGWLAAGTSTGGNTDPTASPTPIKRATPATTAPTPSPSPSPSGSFRPDSFAMPDLVGKTFLEARLEAAKLRLGFSLKFGEPLNGHRAGTVVRTSPKKGTYVWPGLTVIIYVSGPAPEAIVPEVAGKPCSVAKDAVLEAGLHIESYPSGEAGNAVRTDPPAGTTLKWNDRVKVFCSESGT